MTLTFNIFCVKVLDFCNNFVISQWIYFILTHNTDCNNMAYIMYQLMTPGGGRTIYICHVTKLPLSMWFHIQLVKLNLKKKKTSVYLSLQLKIIRCFKATTGSHSLFILIRMLLISNKMNLSQNWPMQM